MAAVAAAALPLGWDAGLFDDCSELLTVFSAAASVKLTRVAADCEVALPGAIVPCPNTEKTVESVLEESVGVALGEFDEFGASVCCRKLSLHHQLRRLQQRPLRRLQLLSPSPLVAITGCTHCASFERQQTMPSTISCRREHHAL